MDMQTIVKYDDDKSTFQIVRIPSTTCFIVRQYRLILYVDPFKKKSMELMDLQDSNVYVSRSLALTTIDDKDPSKGFWMAYIDNKSKTCPEVKCMSFEKQLMD